MPKTPRAVAEGEYLQTPLEMEAYHQFSGCINCMLCYAACPQFGLDDRFLGPGVTALLHRYNNVRQRVQAVIARAKKTSSPG